MLRESVADPSPKTKKCMCNSVIVYACVGTPTGSETPTMVCEPTLAQWLKVVFLWWVQGFLYEAMKMAIINKHQKLSIGVETHTDSPKY